MNTNEKIRVLGKGLTAKGIKNRFPEAILYDDRDFNLYDQNSNDITIVSPGIPPYNEMVLNAKNIQSDYDLVNMPFSIWISGTNGKTTTTQMIQHLLENKGALYGGNIGTPICSLDESAPIWILETSSFTMHYIKKAKPNLYVLLPISEDHISWHGTYEAYQEAKLKPLSLMKEGEIAIIPEQFASYPTQAHTLTYKDSDDLCEKLDIDKRKIQFDEPFLLDALLALVCQKVIFDEVNYDLINKFTIDPHKIEKVYDESKRLWINDSKATNVDATINALVPYQKEQIHLILGGDDKGANLEPLFNFIRNMNIEIYIIGSNAKRLIEYSSKFNLKFTECKILDKAVEKIDRKHDKNSLAILSPAAASLDQFTSYSARGNLFKELVKNLSKN